MNNSSKVCQTLFLIILSLLKYINSPLEYKIGKYNQYITYLIFIFKYKW